MEVDRLLVCTYLFNCAILELEISIYDMYVMYIQYNLKPPLYWGRQNTMMLPFAYYMCFLHAPKNLLKGGENESDENFRFWRRAKGRDGGGLQPAPQIQQQLGGEGWGGGDKS